MASGGAAPLIPDLDLVSVVLGRASELADTPALIDGSNGRTLTYGDLQRDVRRLANGLAARGFGAGDTACVVLPNVPEFPVAFHGVLASGGRCATANPLYTPRELAHQLTDTHSRLVFTTTASAPSVHEAASGQDVDVVVIDDVEPFGGLLSDGDDVVECAVDPRNVAAVLYSGGTTGLPKGVMLTHRNLVASITQTSALFDLGPDDVVIAALPFFHVYGLNVILNRSLAAGATVVAMSRFELGAFLALIERHRVTRGYIVPPMAVALVNDPIVDDHDLSSLRNVLSGAAILGAELAEACERRVGCPVTQGYGMTEMSSVTHLAPLFGKVRKQDSIGLPVPGTDCRVVNPETGEDRSEGEAGELLLRGEHVMAGYLNNPEATAATVDADGWLHTGDLVVVDEDGWFRVVARLKEIIKYKGYQVAPAELEALLLEHPDVTDCAVVGRPDNEAGEIPVAFIVPATRDLDAEKLMAYIAERVAPYKRIRRVETIAEIPKSPSGRILRRLLEQQ
jgi:acyl-CoA synthetase (AMP-forming)/AMP-acid ligase II